MTEDSKQFKRKLKLLGLSGEIIDAAWPGWWNDEAEASPSARAELRFSVSRKLGLNPKSLLDESGPEFIWKDEAKFKGLTTEDKQQRAAIESFGASISRSLLNATPASDFSILNRDAGSLRKSILGDQPFITLTDLLATCWSIGIPVLHLRVFPLSAKHMCAMAIRVQNRYVILIGKDSEYPAPIAYYLAHELGHISLGHLENRSSIIDLDDPLTTNGEWDDEEREADQFALQLLTNRPSPIVNTDAQKYTARQLAEHVLAASLELRIEPGTLALCFGHSMQDWPRVTKAMRYIYKNPIPAWSQVNGIANSQLLWDELADDAKSYIYAIMGGRH